jgi:hypothetical protein
VSISTPSSTAHKVSSPATGFPAVSVTATSASTMSPGRSSFFAGVSATFSRRDSGSTFSAAYPDLNAGAPTSAPRTGAAFVRPRTRCTETNAFGRRSSVMGTRSVGVAPTRCTRSCR